MSIFRIFMVPVENKCDNSLPYGGMHITIIGCGNNIKKINSIATRFTWMLITKWMDVKF